LRHRGTEFNVEEGPPSWWHWIIYPGADEHVIAYETALQDLLDKKQKGSRSRRWLLKPAPLF
jgi:hypothetical protein